MDDSKFQAGLTRAASLRQPAAKSIEQGEENGNSKKLRRKFWRQSLEKVMDSVWVSLMVMGLVLIDVVQILYFQFGVTKDAEEPDPTEQVIHTHASSSLQSFMRVSRSWIYPLCAHNT